MAFRKSSYCYETGCVEVDIEYRTSSFCSGGDCVEVGMGFVKASASNPNGARVQVKAEEGGEGVIVVKVRDSKNPDGPVLEFTEAEWEAFLLGMDAGLNCEFRIKRPAVSAVQ